MITLDVLVLDSNKKSAQELSAQLLKAFPEVKIKGTAHTLADAVTKVESLHPDLVFLNIDLTGKNGVDLYAAITEVNVELVFYGVHDGNAIRCISQAALECITIPLTEKKIKKAIAAYFIKKKGQVLSNRILNIMEAVSSDPATFNKLVIPEVKGYSFVKICEILYVEADGNYSNVHLITGITIVSSRTLKYFADLLPNASYFRIHKSFLVNLNLIKKVVRNGGLSVIMENNEELEVADRNRKDFVNQIISRNK